MLFRQSRLVKNVYQGSSSLVARVFLLKPVYTSVQQIVEEIETRGGFVTQPTVSKALKQLEEDVIIWRDKNEIKLVQPDKLLDRLVANYKRPHVLSELSFKFESDFEQIPNQIFFTVKQAKAKIVLGGAVSVNEYATMAREKQYIFYCNKDSEAIIKMLGKPIAINSRFPNVTLIETEDPTVYFDMRIRNQNSIASPIQVYLELMSGDKREKETAQ